MNGEFTKYHFLEACTSGLTLKHDVTGVLCIDMDERDNDGGSYAIDVPEQSLALSIEKAELDEIMVSSTSYDGHGQMCPDESEDGTLTRNDTEAIEDSTVLPPPINNKHFLGLPSDRMTGDVISEDEERSWSSISGSQSITASDTAMDEGQHFSKLDNQMAVMISPDYVIHESILYGESQIVFSADCIKIECSDASRSDEKFSFEWAVADIVHIDCQWSRSVAIASVKIFLRVNNATKSEKQHNDYDVFKVMFYVNDMHWLEKEQQIWNLAARYKDTWNTNFGDMVCEDDTADPNVFFSRNYFIETPDSFEDVIYPKGDPDAVSINKRDIDLLQPETFVNDTIIDFYIKYLKNKIQPDQKHRFHFFNSFFFRKLADLDKDQGSVSEGRAAFLRVQKWTRKVNIFEKDYIFIPVNFNLHWSLLVICHPGEVTKSKDSIIESNKVPCILHMDSIKGSHSGLKNIIQSYIWEEWKERHPETTEDDALKFLNLRFVQLELPQQDNSFDCGLFLLHYAELFLEEAPVNFNPFKITKLSSFLNAVWFPPAEASLKRSFIHKLIYELNDPSQKKVNLSACSNGHPSTPMYPENNIEQEPYIEPFSVHCNPAKGVMDDAVCFDAEDVTQIELLSSSSAIHCDKQAKLMLTEFLEPGTNTMPLNELGEHVHQHNSTSSKLLFASCPIAEHIDGMEHSSSLSREKEDCRPLDENLNDQFGTNSSPKTDRTFEMPWSTANGKDVDVDLAVESMIADCMNVNQRSEDEKIRLALPDTTSSRENTDDIVEESQDTDTTKAEDRDCEDPQRICAREVDDPQNVFEAGDITDCQVTNATREDGDDVYQKIDTNVVGVEGGDDRQATSSKVEKLHGDSHEIHSMKVRDGNCQENLPSSSQDIIIVDDEKPLDKDDVGGTSKKLVQQPRKRRKVTIPEGTRMRTRSFTRESHNDNRLN